MKKIKDFKIKPLTMEEAKKYVKKSNFSKQMKKVLKKIFTEE